MLDNYFCTRCNSNPLSDKEVFFGCAQCGNKFFRIQDEQTNQCNSVSSSQESSPPASPEDLNLISISITDAGVYNLNIDKIFKDKKGSSPLTITDKEGVYHIKL